MPECTESKHLTQHQESHLQTRADLMSFAYQMSSLDRMCSEKSQSQEHLPVARGVCKNQGTCQELVSHELIKAINQEYLPASRAHFWKEKLWMSLWC